MSQLDQMDGWEMEHTGEVLVFEFGPGVDLDAFGEEAWEAYTDALARDDRLKRMSTRSKLDVEGLEVEGFDDRAEALAWARPD